MRSALDHGRPIFATRVDEALHEKLACALGSPTQQGSPYRYYSSARIASLFSPFPDKLVPRGITVMTGGTADIAVAEEAAVTLEQVGIAPRRVYVSWSVRDFRLFRFSVH